MHMAGLNRRIFLLSSAALAVGCTLGRPEGSGGRVSSPTARQPEVGQSWRYAKRDAFTHNIVDEQVDRVSAVGATIDVESHSVVTPAATPAWGSAWLKKYLPQRDIASGPLPSEIQDPWGLIRVDPHWGEVQVYENPIPLWPSELRSGWSIQVNTKYKTPAAAAEGLIWEQTMTAHEWETISVPAGQFKALRFTNMIRFTSDNPGRSDSQRQEIVWFVPKIGRWAARESMGTYYNADSVDDAPVSEAGYRWELLSYS